VRRVAGWTAAALLAGSAAAGFWWQKNKIERGGEGSAPVSAVSPEQKAEALRLVDEAVAAKHEGRAQTAVNTAQRARSVDPEVRGVDILLGEMAFEAQEPQSAERAAREALRREDNIADAKLLLALAAWMQRDGMGKNTSAAQSALQYLDEAASDELSNAPVFFFRGELERWIGGSGVKAQRALLGAVHRMQPWFSTAVLEAKRYAAAVAHGGALGDVAAAPAGPPMVTLEEVSGPAAPAPAEAVAALARSLTSVQVQSVVRDQGRGQTDTQLFDDQYFEPIPYGKIDAPDPGEM
jgi:tetratricopeptide (TPR) repeat protein